MASQTQLLASGEPLFLADHPALDFLNSVAQVDGNPYDFWQSDDDVLAWLNRAGMTENLSVGFTSGELLLAARRLREIIRTLVAQKKAGDTVEVALLNDYLAAASSHQQLVAEEGRLLIQRVYHTQTPVQLLAPVAEYAASLLAEDRFELVRECEHPECSLWFYDRTKAHRRRWCSMALCGNRAKVSRFRQQQK